MVYNQQALVMSASNTVIAGDYKGCSVRDILDRVEIVRYEGWSSNVVAQINKYHVESYEEISEERNRSAGNVAVRGLVGAALLGPIGLAAGALSSRKKGTHQIAIQFKDGKKSLIEVDDKIAKKINLELF